MGTKEKNILWDEKFCDKIKNKIECNSLVRKVLLETTPYFVERYGFEDVWIEKIGDYYLKEEGQKVKESTGREKIPTFKINTTQIVSANKIDGIVNIINRKEENFLYTLLFASSFDRIVKKSIIGIEDIKLQIQKMSKQSGVEEFTIIFSSFLLHNNKINIDFKNKELFKPHSVSFNISSYFPDDKIVIATSPKHLGKFIVKQTPIYLPIQESKEIVVWEEVGYLIHKDRNIIIIIE